MNSSLLLNLDHFPIQNNGRTHILCNSAEVESQSLAFSRSMSIISSGFPKDKSDLLPSIRGIFSLRGSLFVFVHIKRFQLIVVIHQQIQLLTSLSYRWFQCAVIYRNQYPGFSAMSRNQLHCSLVLIPWRSIVSLQIRLRDFSYACSLVAWTFGRVTSSFANLRIYRFIIFCRL